MGVHIYIMLYYRNKFSCSGGVNHSLDFDELSFSLMYQAFFSLFYFSKIASYLVRKESDRTLLDEIGILLLRISTKSAYKSMQYLQNTKDYIIKFHWTYNSKQIHIKITIIFLLHNIIYKFNIKWVMWFQ